MSIQEHLNKIRNAIYGREVRESIAKGIETAYDDASENGNANMEVKLARGTNPNLNTRLNKMDETDRQTTAQLAHNERELGKKPNRTETGWATLNILTEEERATLLGLEPGEINAVLGLGNVLEDNIGDGEVTPRKIAGTSLSPNILDRENPHEKLYTMNKYGSLQPNNYYYLYKFKVNPGETYTFSNARSTYVVFKDIDDLENTVVDYHEIETPGAQTSFTVPENAYYMYINVFIDYNEVMLVHGTELPETYIPYGFSIDSLEIRKENLSDDVLGLLSESSWYGKKLVTFGDSITWYDRKPFSSTHSEFGETAVGYQTYLRDELGIVVDNQGVSGNHMGQIATIIKGYDLSDIDALTITSGANDWSQERAIGEIQVPMSEFNESTFYGALQSAVESVLTRKPTIKIILITPIRGYHPTNTHSGDWLNKGITVDGMMEQPDDYAKAFRDVAMLYGLEVIDFRDETGMNFFNYAEYMGDTGVKKVHPTNSFYEVMGKYAVEKFKTISI